MPATYPVATGFDLLARLDDLPSIAPCIVFTTAHAEYAIRSFDFNRVDYLLEPISMERVGHALRKLEARALPNGSGTPKAPLEAIASMTESISAAIW